MDETSPEKKQPSVPEPAGSRTIQDVLITCPKCRAENRSDSRFCAFCAAPLKEGGSRAIRIPAFDLARGQLFAGRYEAIEILGQGGMGKVFKAFDRQINEVVAVKLIKPEISVNDSAIERFKNELKIARKITHRNVCRMHDIGEDAGLQYITMEFVAGEDLKRFVRRAGALSPGRAINIARQVCAGLVEAHHLGIVHRDLKPQNIMIDQDGNAKIMDFGIARFSEMDRMTGSGVMIGTPEYMSPEQADLKDVDARADIYALGIVLYEMLTGRMPFEGETALSVIIKHKTEKPKDVRTFNSLVSPELAAVVAKCMEKDPARRFQTSDALSEELDRLEKSLSTGERVGSKPPKPQVSATRQVTVPLPTKKILVPAAAVLGVVVLLFVALKVLPHKAPADASGDKASVDTSGVKAGGEAPKPDPKSAPPAPTSSPVQVGSAAAKPPTDGKTASGTVPPPAKPSEAKPSGTPEAAPAKKEEAKPPVEPAKPGSPNAEMSSASLASTRTAAARMLALKSGVSDKDLFFRIADAEAQEGQRQIGLRSYVDARSMLSVAEKAFRICQERSKDDDRLAALKKLVEGLRADIESRKAFIAGDRAYLAAVDVERTASAFHAGKEVEKAARTYLQAAAAYDKHLRALQAVKN